MTLYTTTFFTPFGPFSAAVDASSAVIATAFGATAALRRRIKATARVTFVADESRTATVRDQVLAYSRGERSGFELNLRPEGSAFQHRVWSALQRIPAGETRSYGDLADALASAPRAVGRANALNPICLLVPCHRVIGRDGSLTGFAFGNAIKQRLLDHEAAMVRASALV